MQSFLGSVVGHVHARAWSESKQAQITFLFLSFASAFEPCINDGGGKGGFCVPISVNDLIYHIKNTVLSPVQYVHRRVDRYYVTDSAPYSDSSFTIPCSLNADPNWEGVRPDLSGALTSAPCSSNNRTA